MRRTIIIAAAASLGFGTGVANAQDNGAITQRVDRLEGQMRAVQRKVFPGGSAQWVQPQITPAETPTLAGPGSTKPVTEIGRASGTERGCRDGYGSVGTGTIKKKKKQ